MKNPLVLAALSACALVATASSSYASFAGQTILGPLSSPANVFGDTTGASDDNDGWFSGGPVFGIWDGGDDVWALTWTGGDMLVELLYDTGQAEVDLFLYVPGSLDESTLDSISGTGFDSVMLPGAAAGTYYILIDSEAGFEGAYNLRVVPAPGGVALLGLGACGLVRRSRRVV